jgi:hypothetical protein
MRLKKVWLTDVANGTYSVTLESNNPQDICNRIVVFENLFPAEPTDKHPLRQTVNLGIFDAVDLRLIRDELSKIISEDSFTEAYNIIDRISKYGLN